MGIYHSEKSLENFLNAGSLPSPLIINAKGGVFNVNGAPGEFFVSDEAKAMLLVYTALGVSLFGTERIAMIHYVNSEVASGNHSKKDCEVIFSLAGVNSLIDYVGSKIATAVNAPTHDVNGYTTDGATNYILSNFIPSTDGVNYTLNNAQAEVFCKDLSSITTFDYLFGVFDGGDDVRLGVDNPTTTSIIAMNSNATVDVVYELGSSELLAVTRVDSSDMIVYKDGVSAHTEAQASTGLSSIVIPIGALNNAGVFGNFAPVTISSVLFGGFLADQPAHNTNLRALLTGLGVSL